MKLALELQLSSKDRAAKDKERAAVVDACSAVCERCGGTGCLEVPHHLDGSATTVECRLCRGMGVVVDDELVEILTGPRPSRREDA